MVYNANPCIDSHVKLTRVSVKCKSIHGSETADIPWLMKNRLQEAEVILCIA